MKALRGIIEIVVVVALVLFLIWKLDRALDKADRWERNHEILQEEMETYMTKTDSILIAEKRAMVMTHRELKRTLKKQDSLRELVSYYRRLASHTQIKTVTQIDTQKIYIPVDLDTSFSMSDPHFSAHFSFRKDTFSLDRLTIPNRQDILTGWKRQGFLKAPELTISVVNSNPYVGVEDINQVTVKPPEKKFYETQWFSGALGLLVGVLIE